MAKIRSGANANQRRHTFRHVQEAGVEVQAAEMAIWGDLAQVADVFPFGLTMGTAEVGDTVIRYAAFKLPNGAINVGRITVDSESAK